LGRGEVHTGFGGGIMKERDNFEDLDVDGRIILKCICRKWDGAWNGFVWLRIGTGGGLL
jgi:hypothetical protein